MNAKMGKAYLQNGHVRAINTRVGLPVKDDHASMQTLITNLSQILNSKSSKTNIFDLFFGPGSNDFF